MTGGERLEGSAHRARRRTSSLADDAVSDRPTSHIPRVSGSRGARHRRPEPGDADAVDLKALLAEYSQVAGGRRHRRAAAEEPPSGHPGATAPVAVITERPLPGEVAATTSRAGRNLPAAIAVGVGAGALIIGSLFAYRPSFVARRLADGASGYLRDVSASVLVLVYLPLLAGFAVLLTHPDDGAARVLAFIGTVVCSDTGGYATGVLFGKHPLAPVVSKGKTWEGFAGSVIACCLCGSLIMTLTFHEAWWKGVVFGAAIVVTATVGDLGESMIKRDLGLKDMGRLLPGHGGIMDRLDSLLPCAAVAYLVLAAYVPA